MSLGFKKIKPTKPELDALKRKLKFAQRGKHLLELKKQQIFYRLQNTLNKYLEQFKKTRNKIILSYEYLNKCYMQYGKRRIRIISEFNRISYEPIIKINFINELGIDVPIIDLKLYEKEKFPSYSFQDTPIIFDTLTELMKNSLNEIVNLAKIEYELFHLASLYKRIQRRIKALESKIIPQLSDNIRSIEEILEDLEQEEIIQIRKIKELNEKKE